MPTVKKRSQKQEKSVAKDFNARVTPASGALWGQKGDVRSDKFLIECKTTWNTFYPLTAKTWDKIYVEATKDHGRIPLMVIDLEDKDRVVVFRVDDFITKPPEPLEVTCNENQKTFRISAKHLDEHTETFGSYVYGKLFLLCASRRYMLCYMRMKDFQEHYKEELYEP